MVIFYTNHTNFVNTIYISKSFNKMSYSVLKSDFTQLNQLHNHNFFTPIYNTIFYLLYNNF